MSLYDKASLIMTPSGAKATKLYSHKPHNGNGDFTHDRNAGTATRVNKDGYIEAVAEDVPRLDYPLIDGVVQDCPALLLEPARTQLIRYSEDFSQSAWGKYNTTVQSNQIISPDGTQNADALFETTDNNFHFTFETITSSANTEYNFSVFVKKLNRRYVGIQGFYNVTRGSIAFFDLDNGTLGYTFSEGTGYSISDAKIEEYPNDWYRLSANFTAPDTEIYMGLCLADERWTSGTAYDNLYAGDTTKGVYLWGAQLEQGSYPTSYIPNDGTTATLTRNADVCDSAGTSAEFNDSEGVLYVEAAALFNDGTNRFIAISDGSNDDRVQIIYSSSNDTINSSVIFGNTSQCSFSEGSITTTDFNKLAIKYKEDDFAFWFNGFEKDTDSDGSTPLGLNTLGLERPTNVSRFLGRIKEVATFKTALTDSELEQLTSWDSFTEMATSQEYSIR